MDESKGLLLPPPPLPKPEADDEDEDEEAGAVLVELGPEVCMAVAVLCDGALPPPVEEEEGWTSVVVSGGFGAVLAAADEAVDVDGTNGGVEETRAAEPESVPKPVKGG